MPEAGGPIVGGRGAPGRDGQGEADGRRPDGPPRHEADREGGDRPPRPTGPGTEAPASQGRRGPGPPTPQRRPPGGWPPRLGGRGPHADRPSDPRTPGRGRPGARDRRSPGRRPPQGGETGTDGPGAQPPATARTPGRLDGRERPGRPRRVGMGPRIPMLSRRPPQGGMTGRGAPRGRPPQGREGEGPRPAPYLRCGQDLRRYLRGFCSWTWVLCGRCLIGWGGWSARVSSAARVQA